MKIKKQNNDTAKILHATCVALKEELPDEILFLSYDYDSIVIMCPNQNAVNKIKHHVTKKSLVQED